MISLYDSQKIQTYRVYDQLEARPLHIHGTYQQECGVILQELPTLNRGGWIGVSFAMIVLLVAMFISMYLMEVRIFPLDDSWYELSFVEKHGVLWVAYLLYLIPLIFCAKRFSKIRYLFVKEGKVTVVGRAYGRRDYRLRDLKFHVVENIDREWLIHGLVVEIVDETLELHERVMAIEFATNLLTLEGILATLLPLLRGDDEAYQQSERRPFIPLSPEKGHRIIGNYLNLADYRNIWLVRYKLNDLLFYIVHGSRKSIFEREIARLSKPLIEYKGVITYE